MTRKEKIINVLKKMAKDNLNKTVIFDEIANAILSLPLDVPSEEEIKNRYGKSPSNHIHGDRFAEESAKWAINEIIERNK